MKLCRLIAIFTVILLLCACAPAGGEESTVQSGGEIGSVPQQSKSEPQDAEKEPDYAPTEQGYELYDFPKPEFSAEDIAEFDFAFSANFVLTKTGDVYAWGLNDGGVLGLGLPENAMVLNPAKVEIGEPVREIAVNSGGYAAAALGESGKLYGWGLNFSACFPNEEKAVINAPAALDTDMEIEHIALDTMLVLCGKNGDVYICGCFGDEAMSFAEQYYQTGKIAESRSLELVGNVPNIKSVSVSGDCAAFLTGDGEVYTIGRIGRHTDFDKLGKYTNDKITKTDFPEKIVKAKALTEGLAALSESGKLYYMGHDVYGIADSREELEASFADAEKNRITKPAVIEKIGGKVADFETGGGNIIVRTEDGELYTWGYDGGSFTCANEKSEFVLKPRKIDFPAAVTRMSIGNFAGAAITESGRAFAWGSGYYCIYTDDTYAKSHTPRELLFGK